MLETFELFLSIEFHYADKKTCIFIFDLSNWSDWVNVNKYKWQLKSKVSLVFLLTLHFSFMCSMQTLEHYITLPWCVETITNQIKPRLQHMIPMLFSSACVWTVSLQGSWAVTLTQCKCLFGDHFSRHRIGKPWVNWQQCTVFGTNWAVRAARLFRGHIMNVRGQC